MRASKPTNRHLKCFAIGMAGEQQECNVTLTTPVYTTFLRGHCPIKAEDSQDRE